MRSLLKSLLILLCLRLRGWCGAPELPQYYYRNFTKALGPLSSTNEIWTLKAQHKNDHFPPKKSVGIGGNGISHYGSPMDGSWRRHSIGKLNKEIPLDAPQLIRHRGYHVEIHKVVTADGYVLEVHRIPAPGRPLTFLYHGMMQSSRDFLMNFGNKAIAFKLADAGYDVWLGNSRGNEYSSKHVFLKRNSRRYWNFSVDEIIRYDIAAYVDYALAVTGKSKLNWIGYSLGSAVMLGLLSTQPAYNEKINVFFTMGTTAYVGGVKSPLIRFITPLEKVQEKLSKALNRGEYLPQFLFPLMRNIFPLMCYPEAKLDFVGVCQFFLFIIAGFSVRQANPGIIPVMLGGTPNSVSVKMLGQWYQWINNGEFTYFDYGRRGNLARYHRPTPPVYDISRVTAKTINIWAQNDWLSVPKDVHNTVADLPNVVANIRVDMSTFNHLDFIYGSHADVLVYDVIIGELNKYN